MTPPCWCCAAPSSRRPASCRPARTTTPTEWKVFLNLLRERFETDKTKWTKIAESVKGVTEETTTGVLRLYQFAAAGELAFPAINVNDSVTKSKFDNKYGTRHSLIDGINRGTDVLIGGKNVLICGYGDVGKGCAESLKGQGARVTVTEIDPINALQALMDGFDVKTVEEAIGDADIVITATGNKDIITLEHMQRDEGQGDPGQHRPLRRRDPDRRAGAGFRRYAASTSSRRSTSSSSATGIRSSCCPRAGC